MFCKYRGAFLRSPFSCLIMNILKKEYRSLWHVVTVYSSSGKRMFYFKYPRAVKHFIRRVREKRNFLYASVYLKATGLRWYYR